MQNRTGTEKVYSIYVLQTSALEHMYLQYNIKQDVFVKHKCPRRPLQMTLTLVPADAY